MTKLRNTHGIMIIAACVFTRIADSAIIASTPMGATAAEAMVDANDTRDG